MGDISVSLWWSTASFIWLWYQKSSWMEGKQTAADFWPPNSFLVLPTSHFQNLNFLVTDQGLRTEDFQTAFLKSTTLSQWRHGWTGVIMCTCPQCTAPWTWAPSPQASSVWGWNMLTPGPCTWKMLSKDLLDRYQWKCRLQVSISRMSRRPGDPAQWESSS